MVIDSHIIFVFVFSVEDLRSELIAMEGLAESCERILKAKPPRQTP